MTALLELFNVNEKFTCKKFSYKFCIRKLFYNEKSKLWYLYFLLLPYCQLQIALMLMHLHEIHDELFHHTATTHYVILQYLW